MDHFSRRDFIKAVGASGALLVSGHAFARATKPPMGRVVVIGGGYAGAEGACVRLGRVCERVAQADPAGDGPRASG